MKWNSQIGKERWQAGFVMDICRGSMLAQPWSDTPWLSPPERREIAELIALLRARPECFGNSRFILGNPWKNEPYGYCCCDGRRAFLALHNCTWEDRTLPLQLNSAWGLPEGQAWTLYRWYPDPAQLGGDGAAFGREVSICLRPFEIVLLEAVPSGQAPSLDRRFDVKPLPLGFAEASRRLEVREGRLGGTPAEALASIWTLLEPTSFVSAGGATLTKQADGSILAGGKTPSPDTYTITPFTDLSGITAFRLEVLPDPGLPQKGPGRANSGNFMLNEFRVTAAPQGNPSAAAPVALKNPVADFSQVTHGDWPVVAAIDGDPRTGWSVYPQQGCPHVAVFEVQKPIGFAGGTTLAFTLEQGEREHSIGRLRLAATTAEPPIALPPGYGPAPLVVEAPASRSGGTLVVAAEISRGSAPMMLTNTGGYFSCRGREAGQSVTWQPVLAEKIYYPASWQAWRMPVEAATEPRTFELFITATLPAEAEVTYLAYFIPED